MTHHDRVHADAVGDAIRGTAEALGPWVAHQIGVWPPDRRGRVSPHDPAYLVTVILDQWMGTFRATLGDENLALVHKYRDLRNRWAHNEALDAHDAMEAEGIARRLLSAIGAAYEVSPVEGRSPGVGATPGEHRKARSPEFRREQWDQRFAPHVAPINQLVDALIVERPGSWMPYVAPYHGGTQAEILLLYQDPGPMTSTTNGGSGFIGCENDDPTAELLALCLDQAQIAQAQVTPWNSYPWFVPAQGGVTAGMMNQGIEPLHRLLDLLPGVHVVITGGKVAHETWRRFTSRHREEAARYRHLETFHTSRRGITNGGQQTRAEGVAHVVATLRSAQQTTRVEP